MTRSVHTSDDDVIMALRKRINELEEEIQASRYMTEQDAAAARSEALASRIKSIMRPRGVGPARMLALLYGASRPLNAAWLNEAIPATKTDERQLGVINVWATYIREILPPGGLQVQYGLGYSLTDTGRAAVRAALGLTEESKA
jgi:hypothetical protein